MEEEEALQLDVYAGAVDGAPDDLKFSSEPVGLDMHPSSNLIATGLISGHVFLHRYGGGDVDNTLVYDGSGAPLHQAAARCVQFVGNGGDHLVTSGTDMRLNVMSVETGAVVFGNARAHLRPVGAVLSLGEWNLASGSDEGVVKVWDLRARQVVAEFQDNEDYIGDLVWNAGKRELVAAGGDGYLSVFNLRKNALEARSDNMEDELLSACLMKHGTKLVVGSQSGVLNIWSHGDWGDISDRFPGHPESIDGMVKLDEESLCTGSSDGIIRLINIHPNEMVGVLGVHSEFPIESLVASPDKRLLATSSHDAYVKFWDIGYIYDADEDDQDEDEEMRDAPRGQGFFGGM